MTSDTVKLLARYNRHANAEMGRICAGLSDEEWNRALGGYYPSIRALCSHVFQGDLAWLKRFAALRPFRYGEHPISQRPLVWGELLFPSYAEFARERPVVDDLLLQFADEVTPEDFPQRLRYKNWHGVDQDREFGGLVMHVFNHQTHHRGMVSLYLDMLGKQNDFSNIITLV
jgi:uncharacterized damage-inducible protein DinB